MAEYVEKSIIFPALNKAMSENGALGMADVEDIIDDLPTADVHPVKRGEWICNEELYYNGMAKCSCCNAEFYVEDLQALQGDAECVKFCPNCGADMIGDENG